MIEAILMMVSPLQTVTLTEAAGRPLIVGEGRTLGDGLTPATLAPDAIAAEFQRICLPDPAGAAARVDGGALSLRSDDGIFAAEGKFPEARVTQWSGPSARIALSSGTEDALKGRPIAITQRAYATTGPYGPFRASGAQCNLVVMVPDFAAATALVEALGTRFGTAGKLVSKKTFIDGHWMVADSAPPVRINITVPTTRNGPQPVHISAQITEKGSKR
jgi:hypothetical protein